MAQKKDQTKEELEEEIRILCGSNSPKTLIGNLRDLQEESTFRLEGEKFKFFEPNGKGEEFIRAVGDTNEDGKHNFIILFSAANGVGKTATAANMVAHILWGEESTNKYFDLPLFKNFPFPKHGRIVSDPTNISKNLIPTLEEWFPADRYERKKAGKQYFSEWKTDTGHKFDIMSYEQDAKEFESTTLGWAWFDEPPPKAIFTATVSRMRKGGIIFISETPLYAAWLYDHIIANPDKDLAKKGQRIYIEADVEAACKQHGIRGHLEHDNIQRMIDEYSEDEKQARVFGKFQHLVGLRFKQFSRPIHVIKPFDIDFKKWSVYHALDTHPRNEDAGTWIAINEKGTKIVVDEFYANCQGGTEELARRLKEKNENYRIVRKILEPAAFNEDQHADVREETLAIKLSKLGHNYLKAPKQRNASDKRIEDALTYTKVNLNGVEEFIKAPELYVFDTCARTIFELEHYRWAEWKGKTAEDKDKKEVTVDKDDHTIENIGRILIQEPQFVRVVEESDVQQEEKNYDPYDR